MGIANSIDLTERALPHLDGAGCRPQLLTFASYSAAQLTQLLTQLQARLPGPAFQDKALVFCAKAVRVPAWPLAGTCCRPGATCACQGGAGLTVLSSFSLPIGEHRSDVWAVLML